MNSIAKTLLPVALLSLIIPMTACHTTSAEISSAVTCDKCKTVWVKSPVRMGGASSKGGFYAMRDVRKMTCPDCESAVATFFRTGSLKHECSHCGGTMTHCTRH